MKIKENEHSIEYQYKCPKCGKNICIEVPKSRPDIVISEEMCRTCREPGLYSKIVK